MIWCLIVSKKEIMRHNKPNAANKC
jgi:hypothetical protein